MAYGEVTRECRHIYTLIPEGLKGCYLPELNFNASALLCAPNKESSSCLQQDTSGPALNIVMKLQAGPPASSFRV